MAKKGRKGIYKADSSGVGYFGLPSSSIKKSLCLRHHQRQTTAVIVKQTGETHKQRAAISTS